MGHFLLVFLKTESPVFEILGYKRIGVTSLTFRGQVKSSVTWAFESPIHLYWWSFEPRLYLYKFPRYSVANVSFLGFAPQAIDQMQRVWGSKALPLNPAMAQSPYPPKYPPRY